MFWRRHFQSIQQTVHALPHVGQEDQIMPLYNYKDDTVMILKCSRKQKDGQ